MAEQPQQSSPQQDAPQQQNTQQNTQQSQGLEQLSSAAKKAGPVAEILYAVAGILPTSLGRPLRDLANTLRRTDMAARRIERAKEKMDKQN